MATSSPGDVPGRSPGAPPPLPKDLGAGPPMFCPACRRSMPQSATVCPACGARVDISDPGQDPFLRVVLPVGRSALAIAAGYLGLVSVLMVPAPFALVIGLLAIRDIRRHPEKHGMGRAIFGVVMGGLFTILLLGVLLLGIVSAARGTMP